MHFGETLKMIRKNRQMTQQKVCKNIIPQGTYSRIEKGQLQLTLENMVIIAERLNISLNEFMYIHQGYNATIREKILKDFREIEVVGIEDISLKQSLLKQVNTQDSHLSLIDQTYDLFQVLIDTGDVKKVQSAAIPIWEELQKLDHWYLEDLELLNAILYYFPVDVAEQVVQTALKRIYKYNDYEKNVASLTIYFQINLANMYIGAQLYDKSLAILTKLLANKKTMSYQVLSMAYTLMIITKIYINQSYDQQYRQLIQLLEAYEDNSLKINCMQQIDLHEKIALSREE